MSEVYDKLCREYTINICESIEVFNYIRDFTENSFSNLSELNNYLTDNEEWEYYPTIRSLNTHGIYSKIPGIQPKYFLIVCIELGIKGGKGRSLDGFEPY